MNRIFRAVSLVLIVVFLLLGNITVFAETAANNTEVSQAQETELPNEIKQLQSLCEKLPASGKVTAEDGEVVISAKKLYDSIDRSKRAKIGSENLQKISNAYEAYLPFLLKDIMEKVEAIPHNPSESDKESIIEVYELYGLLSESEREIVAESENDFTGKLLKSVKVVAPQLLSEEETTIATEYEANEKEEIETEDKKSTTMTVWGIPIWKFVALVISAIIVVLNLVIIVFVTIKIFKTVNK